MRRVILSRQDPVTGLLPASTAVNEHGDYTDAWVRDNVYSVLAVWGVALAYRRVDDGDGTRFELEQAVVKVMRGLLRAMMGQAPKVEAFKSSQDPRDALHAKYDPRTGAPAVGDDAWGHLQLDATGLFLVTRAQMIASGLPIVASRDEVAFVQNLVFYIGRAYRTPDYGIWERGDKTNHGLPELNASSVALCKAALEALAGFDLYGVRGGQASVVHVLPDEIARARITLESLLPRESSSKEIDAALLPAVGFPAFAVEDVDLVETTRAAIAEKLGGRHGVKRFLRDGHQTVIEDPHRLHYDPDELAQFEGIECEWPLFWTYQAIDAFFDGDGAAAREALEALEGVAVPGEDGDRLLPELYLVPEGAVAAERADPGSQPRVPNQNVPLVWAQSLWVVARLLERGLLEPGDLDPLGRRRRQMAARGPTVQLALLAEDADVQAELADAGVVAQTLGELSGIGVIGGSELTKAFARVGVNPKLGLSGLPPRRMHTLTTSRMYRLAGRRVACLPTLFDRREFYLSLDPEHLLQRLRTEIAYLHRHWALPGRPTLTLLLTREMIDTGRSTLLAFMDELRSGSVGGAPVRLGPLELLAQAANEERIDELYDFEPEPLGERDAHPRRRWLPEAEAGTQLSPEEELAIELEPDAAALRERLAASRTLVEQAELLASLVQRDGLEGPSGLGCSVATALEELYVAAGRAGAWGVVRRAASLLEMVDVSLSDALSDLLVRQKHVLIGKAYSEESLITRPLPQKELLERIRTYTREDIRERVLTQEIIVYLSGLIRSEPDLFRGTLTVQVGRLILLLVSDLAAQEGIPQEEAFDRLTRLPPSEVEARLRHVLREYRDVSAVLKRMESISAAVGGDELTWIDLETAESESERRGAPRGEDLGGDVPPSRLRPALPTPPGGWWRWRQREGALTRVESGFFRRVWRLMEHSKGLIIGDKLERRNRLDSSTLLAHTTSGEKNFALRVEHLLNKIPSPEYRQLSVEALEALARLTDANPDLAIDGWLVVDVIVGHAVRRHWLDAGHDASGYDTDRSAAWASFYEQSPPRVERFVIEAFRYLLERGAGSELAAGVAD